MSRPPKQGLDYFYVVCDPEDKIEYLEAKHGIVGFGVLIKLWRRIYKRHGYWCEWDERAEIMFAKKIGITLDNLREIVATCLAENIFSLEKYQEHKVLTSSGVQKHWLEVSKNAKRRFCEIDVKYSLSMKPPEETTINSGLFRKKQGFPPEEMPQSKLKERIQIQNTVTTLPISDEIVDDKKHTQKIVEVVIPPDLKKKKKVAPKKKGKNPDAEPYWHNLRKIWVTFNRTHLKFNVEPIPSRDYSHLHRIIEKLRERATGQAVLWTEENALSRFEKFLTIAYTKDDWLKDHFELGNLESKMQTVFKLIDNPNGQAKQKFTKSTTGSVGRTIEFDKP